MSPSHDAPGVDWRKSRVSQQTGECVEIAVVHEADADER